VPNRHNDHLVVERNVVDVITTTCQENSSRAWTAAAGITHGQVFRAINKAGCVWRNGMSPKVLWDVAT
jgi:hypothetical protein